MVCYVIHTVYIISNILVHFSDLYRNIREKNPIFQKLPPKSHATYISLHFFEKLKHLLWNPPQLDKVCVIAFKKTQTNLNACY